MTKFEPIGVKIEPVSVLSATVAVQSRSTMSVAKDLTPIGTSANSETNTHGVHGVHGVQNEQGLRNNAVRPPPKGALTGSPPVSLP